MLAILLSILVVAVTFTFIVKFMMWYIEITTHASLTSRFQEAEHIVNEHSAPDSWRKPVPLYTRMIQGSFFEPIIQLNADGHKRLLRRLDNLILFFEQSRLFDNPDTKAQLLNELRLERKRWETLSAETIFSQKQ